MADHNAGYNSTLGLYNENILPLIGMGVIAAIGGVVALATGGKGIEVVRPITIPETASIREMDDPNVTGIEVAQDQASQVDCGGWNPDGMVRANEREVVDLGEKALILCNAEEGWPIKRVQVRYGTTPAL